ncbi:MULTISPECIES: murein hydrolase activator NlpD [unclassified Providencia]|uniref:murein hydrolase activator NlpD n=1 Tax=unclassified Providencia TaxID=2633465 RepID=UPI000E82EAF4|nr:murein hydrolase activator NlpD [Providencia sp.]MBP6083423.1 murein hydrolase activator NlpD [Providencia sp.]HBO24752.1 murein hydrolase activator NlpD [Providencia sp.]
MKIVSPISRARWAVIFSFSGVLLAGCSTPYHTAAPISSVNDGQSSQQTAQRTSVNTTSNTGMSTAMPSSRPNLSSNTQSVNRASSQINTSTDGRIVYNRDYGSIPKGSYNGNSYTVQRGDTLFYIAYITGNDFRELASKNGIAEPYSLNVGQVINIGNTNVNSNTQIASNSSNSHQQAVDLRTTNEYPENSGGQTSGKMLPNNKKPATQVSTTTNNTTTTASTAASSTNNSSIKWRWPADGKMIEGFSDAQGGNKGVDIAGSRGQAVLASAPGKVVYAGNALRGYGNLIIIKHNDDYLSAYAHNDTLLVRDQQDVTEGQKIATMGSTGTSSVRLHFEIRYKGKSVNPLRYLPQR